MVENGLLFAQLAHSARYAPIGPFTFGSHPRFRETPKAVPTRVRDPSQYSDSFKGRHRSTECSWAISRFEEEEHDLVSHLPSFLGGGRSVKESKPVQMGPVVFTGTLLPGADQACLYVIRRIRKAQFSLESSDLDPVDKDPLPTVARPLAGQQSAPHMHVLVCICSNVRQFH